MTTTSGERADILAILNRQRSFLTHTVEGLSDDQAREATGPPSELTLGGLIKHVSATEAGWAEFAVRGAEAIATGDDFEAAMEARAREFTLLPDETLTDALAGYDKVAARTNELIQTLDLDSEHALPQAPWFEPGASWTARRVFVHIIAETAQHSGHADFLREAIDGQKTMG